MINYDIYILDKNSCQNQRKLDGWYYKLGEQKKNYGLKDIDNVTIKYNSLEDFRIDLYKNNLITLKELEGKGRLSIRNKSNKGLNYGLIFKNDENFLKVDYLKKFIGNKINDFKFLKKFADKYDIRDFKRTKGGKTVPELKNKSVKYIRKYINNNGVGFQDNEVRKVLNFIIDLNVYKIKKEEDKSYKEINYLGLHNLAMFCSNYNNLDNKSITKKRTKSLNGQISLFN